MDKEQFVKELKKQLEDTAEELREDRLRKLETEIAALDKFIQTLNREPTKEEDETISKMYAIVTGLQDELDNQIESENEPEEVDWMLMAKEQKLNN